MHDPIDQALHAERIATAQATGEREARQAVEDLKWQMAHKPGRRQAWRLLSATGVFRNPFSPCGVTMAFRAGEMNAGQRLLADIMAHCPDAFAQMMREANEAPPRRTDEEAE